MGIGSRIILSVTSLPSFGRVPINTVSSVKSFVLSAIELSGNVTIQVTGGFQISLLETSAFSTSKTIIAVNGQIAPTTIYVRFAPIASQAYTGIITASSVGASNQQITLSGTSIIPTITLAPLTLSFTNTPANSVSAEQVISMVSSNLTPEGGMITIAAPEGFQVSTLSGYGFGSLLNITILNGAVPPVNLYVRFAPTEVGSYSGNIRIYGGGSVAQNIAVTGTVSTPTLSLSLASLAFGNIVVGGTSVAQSFVLSGANLSPASGRILLNAPEGYEISLSEFTGYTREISIAYAVNTLAATTIYIRFIPTKIQDYTTKLSVSIFRAETQYVALTGNGIKDWHVVIIGVMIETADGYFYRLSEPENNAAQDGLLHFSNGVYSYPDLRVKLFRIYSKLSSETTYKMQEFGAKKSKASNIAYAVLHGPESSDYLDPATFPNTVTQAEIDAIALTNFGDANVVLVSETFQPRNLLGTNALTIGNSADDGLKVFGSNALSVSDGQFGEYPLFAFTKRGIYALKPGTAVKFESVVPFALNEEIVGKNAILSSNGMLFFLTKRGLKVFVGGKTENLSEQLFDFSEGSLFSSMLNDNACIGYYLEKATGREEVWIGGDTGVFVYSLTFNRWFYLPNKRKEFFTVYDRLIGYDGEKLYEENAGEAEVGKVVTAPIHFGLPELMKRFRRVFYYKGETLMSNETVPAVEALESATARSIELTDSNVAEFNDLTIEYEVRYPHRIGENA
jgi:hypothetical protein